MTDSILMQTLKKHGLERFDPSVEGEMFNPNLHEATFQTKVEGKEDGSVFMTQQKGFKLNGRVVRVCAVPWIFMMRMLILSVGSQGRRSEEQLGSVIFFLLIMRSHIIIPSCIITLGSWKRTVYIPLPSFEGAVQYL